MRSLSVLIALLATAVSAKSLVRSFEADEIHERALSLHEAALAGYNVTGRRTFTLQTDETWESPIIIAKLKIGSENQEYNLQVNHQFGDAVVIGPKCNSIPCKGADQKRKVYDATKSKTSVDKKDPAQIKDWGRPALKGNYFTDNIEINGIKSEAVGLAVLDTANQLFHDVNADGLLGLSPYGITRGRTNLPSPLNAVLAGAKDKVVTFWHKPTTRNADRVGTVTFGKHDNSNCNSDIRWFDVDDDDFVFEVEKIRMGTLTSHRVRKSMLSFDSPYLTLPTTVYKDVLRTLSGNYRSTQVPCNNVKDIVMEIRIGGHYFKLNGFDIARQDPQSSNTCYLMVSDAGGDFDREYEFGEPFFRRYCVSYDIENFRIGFSANKSR